MQNEENKQEKLDLLYKKALLFAKSHYENFPVISLFVPKELRKYIAVVYQFARQADDIADEGNYSVEERIINLDNYEKALLKSTKNDFENDFWFLFNDTVKINNLKIDNFKNLLKAFKQDLVKKNYYDYNDLLGYCKNSADPVGRIILELYKVNDVKAIEHSDQICTALQLTNFYQDVSLDFQKGRIYLPQNEMKNFSVTVEDISSKKTSNSFIELMKFEIDRTKKLFNDGRNILKYLPTRLKIQILATINGGEAILKKIEELNFDVLNKRPKLTKKDFSKIFLQSAILRK